MKALINSIASKHKKDGIDVNPPAKLSEIENFEKRIGFKLPDDFKNFYLIANGFECNEDIFKFINIDEILGNESNYGLDWFYFSEYMIYSDMWGLRLSKSNKEYEIFNASYPEKAMTYSLAEFLERFLRGNVFEEGGLYDWQNELGIGEQKKQSNSPNELNYSFIIPVYNRPDETLELLHSFDELDSAIPFEIVIVEDGSSISSKEIVDQFKNRLNISYYFKDNSGPGDSRNYGMRKAKGNYFIILDSDCILPSNYLSQVETSLKTNYVDCFGGPDAAHESFTNLQKAINFSMTSFITTGGIRGSKQAVGKFQPRSFNMGISKEAFKASNGFGRIHPGEDPDLSIRLWNLGYKTKLIPEAKVYHKRRISWSKFYTQVNKFGLVRPILNQWHPETKKLTYWFPTLFCLGFVVALVLLLFNFKGLLYVYLLYFVLAFALAVVATKSILVSVLAIPAICIQFLGYGYGFLKSTWLVGILKKKPEASFPKLFFK